MRRWWSQDTTDKHHTVDNVRSIGFYLLSEYGFEIEDGDQPCRDDQMRKPISPRIAQQQPFPRRCHDCLDNTRSERFRQALLVF